MNATENHVFTATGADFETSVIEASRAMLHNLISLILSYYEHLLNV